MFPNKMRLRAIKLNKDESASWVLKELEKEFKAEAMPDVRTINRWKHDAEKLEKQISESAEHTKEIGREYWKTHPIPKWLQNLYLVKIENGEIKPL